MVKSTLTLQYLRKAPFISNLIALLEKLLNFADKPIMPCNFLLFLMYFI